MNTTPGGLTELDLYLETSHDLKTSSMHSSSARNTPVTSKKFAKLSSSQVVFATKRVSLRYFYIAGWKNPAWIQIHFIVETMDFPSHLRGQNFAAPPSICHRCPLFWLSPSWRPGSPNLASPPLFRPLSHLACVNWNSSWWFLNPNEAVGERKTIFQKWKFQSKKGLKSTIEVFMKHPRFSGVPVHHDFQHKNLCCKRQPHHLRTSAVEDEALRLGQKKVASYKRPRPIPSAAWRKKHMFGGCWSYETPPLFWVASDQSLIHT